MKSPTGYPAWGHAFQQTIVVATHSPIVLDEDIDSVESEEISQEQEDEDPTARPKLAVGDIAQLVGLSNAPHLNGETASIVDYDTAKGRFLADLNSGERKAVLPSNLAKLNLLDEVTYWRDALSNQDITVSKATTAINRLEALEVTVEVLQKTRIGKVVNQVTKQFSDSPVVVDAGRVLVKAWREKYQREQFGGLFGTSKPDEPLPGDVLNPDSGQAHFNAVGNGCGGNRAEPCPRENSFHEGHWDGKQPHGSRNEPISVDEIMEESTLKSDQCEYVAPSSSSSAPANRPSIQSVEPILQTDDAARLVNVMRNATTDRLRLDALDALRLSEASCLYAFVNVGGLAVIDTWLRSRVDCRLACLNILQCIPVSGQDLKEARIVNTVSLVQRSDMKLENRQKAHELLEKWRAEGYLCSGAPVPLPKLSPAAINARLAKDQRVAADKEMSAPELKRMRVLPPEPDAMSHEDFPPELARLDTRIAKVLKEKPAILEFLAKHRSVMHNLNAESIAFLARNLRNSKDTQGEAALSGVDAGSTTITMSNLHPEVTEADISALLDQNGLGPAEVSLPRESRKQRSCCVAFVALPSHEYALDAIRDLGGVCLRGREICVESVDGFTAKPDGLHGNADGAAGTCGTAGTNRGRHILWKQDEELWEVALFDRTETVVEFSASIGDPSSPTRPTKRPGTEASRRFQDAVAREHAAERQFVREALASQPDDKSEPRAAQT